MKQHPSWKMYFGTILALLIIAFAGITFVRSPGETAISDKSFVTEASWIVGIDGSDTYMKNGDTGEIPWSNSDSSAVIQACIGNLTQVQDKYGEIYVKAAQYNVNSGLTLSKTGVTIRFEQGAVFVPTASSFTFLDVTGHENIIDGLYFRSFSTVYDTFVGIQLSNGVSKNKIYNSKFFFNSTDTTSYGLRIISQTATAAYNYVQGFDSSYGAFALLLDDLSGQTLGINCNTFVDFTADSTRMLQAGYSNANTFIHFSLQNLPTTWRGYYLLQASHENTFIDMQSIDAVAPINVDVELDATTYRNNFYGGVWTLTTDSGTNNNFERGTLNQKLTENSGTATNSVNATWVTHGLAGTPDVVTLTISGSNYINSTCYLIAPTVIASNSTHFQIGFYIYNADTITAVTATDQRDIYWTAEYHP